MTTTTSPQSCRPRRRADGHSRGDRPDSRHPRRRSGRGRRAGLAPGRLTPGSGHIPMSVRPIGHEDRLSLVEHLDELRTRLIICIVGFIVAFGFCYAFSDELLDIINEPLEKTQNLDGKERSNDPLEQSARYQIETGQFFRAAAPALPSLDGALRSLGETKGVDAATRTAGRQGVAPAARGGHPGAAGRRVGADEPRAPAGHARRHRAVPDDLHDRGLRGAAADDAAVALPGIRVRAARVQPGGAPDGAAADAHGAGALHPRACCSRTSSPCRAPSTSCRTSTTTRSTSSCARRTTTGSRSSCSSGSGCCSRSRSACWP